MTAGRGKVIRLGLAATGLVLLAACASGRPAATAAPLSAVPQPATLTPFLPRGFSAVPSSAAVLPPLPDPTLSPSAESLDPSLAIDRLNRLREEGGAPDLRRDQILNEIAQDRADSLAATQSLWHVLPGGVTAPAEQALRSAGFAGKIAEIALSVDLAGEDRLGEILTGLLSDPQNRASALDPVFQAAGLGYAEGGGRGYIVVLLAETSPTE